MILFLLFAASCARGRMSSAKLYPIWISFDSTSSMPFQQGIPVPLPERVSVGEEQYCFVLRILRKRPDSVQHGLLDYLPGTERRR